MAKSYKIQRISFSNFLCDMNVDDDEYSLNANSARLCYNTKTDGGALINGNGFEELILPASRVFQILTRKLNYSPDYIVKKIWRYAYYSEDNEREDYMIVAFGSDYKLYYSNMFAGYKELKPLSDYVFETEPTAMSFRIDGRDVIGFVSPDDPMLVWYCDDYPYQVSTTPKFMSLCYHNNRLFAIEKDNSNLVRYSSKRNPLDWTATILETGAGSVELNDYKGKLRNLISLADNLYIFRDFGISRISTFTSKSNYNAVNIYSSSCKIYCSTACVCGSSVYFLAEDGLYYFDGYNVYNTNIKFMSLIKNVNQDNANTCYHNGNLYIACKLNFNDNNVIGAENEEECINNALIEYNISTKTYNITRGVDISCMLSAKDLFMSKLIICMNGEKSTKLWQLTNNGKLDTQNLPKLWQGGKINFETFDKEKILKEINLICRKPCYITITSECGTKTILISAKNEIQRIRVNLKGKNIAIQFSSDFDDLYILSPQFVFNVEN